MTQTQAGAWTTNPDAYRKKLEGLLSDRDPIIVMSQTADVLAKIVEQHSAKTMPNGLVFSTSIAVSQSRMIK